MLELLVDHGFDGMAQAMQTLLNEAMKLERSQALGAQPYERTPDRRGYANGFKAKSLRTRLGTLELAVPQARGIEFYPSALERGTRSERALAAAVAEMYLQGVSTRKVTAVMEQLCGREVTSMQVSRAVQTLDEELTAWRERPLAEVPYLFLDARYEKVRIGGTVVSCALLVAIGVQPDGRRSVLGLSVSLSEAEVHWREFLAGLQARGLHGVRLITSDDHAGLRAALQARFAGVPWQRCQFHLQQNLIDHLPPNVPQDEASRDLRSVFNAPNRAEADRLLGQMVSKHVTSAPKLAAWLEANVPEGLAVFAFPAEHRRRLRTNNALERLNRELKRRTRVASIFPNEASLLRLATAVLMETDDEWQTEKRYL
ncbi:MAG: IS256 family transposase, partial [Rhodocyclaceae bacterium]|nr:IS256 family transposase [Rhodocyclaceae bacterium]